MSERADPRRKVGVRELRQNLSVYLRRVKHGEQLDVTERGHVVARLTPIRPADQDRLESLVAEGKVKLSSAALAGVGAPPPAGPGRSLSAILREMREEERG